MRISGSGSPHGVEGDVPAKPSRPAAATQNYETSDLLAISAAAAAVSPGAERVSQLKLQVDSGDYFQPSAGIAQKLVDGALSRNY
jgi:hypothetical protein